MVKSTITLRILKLHDLIYSTNPRPKTNFLNHTCSARYSGETNALEQTSLPCKKNTAGFRIWKQTSCSLPFAGSLWLLNLYAYEYLKAELKSLYSTRTFAHHYVHSKLPEMCKFLHKLNYPVKISKKFCIPIVNTILLIVSIVMCGCLRPTWKSAFVVWG